MNSSTSLTRFVWLFSLFGLSLATGDDRQPANIANVETGHFVTSVRVTGKVVPLEGAMFVQAARINGRLLEILKREGEFVSLGTPILKISSAECASLSEESRVAQSRKLDDMGKAIERRENQLDLKLSGDDCVIVASSTGTITRRFLEPGANFNTGDALMHIVDTKKLTVELEVPEKDSSRISVGKKVIIHLAAGSDKNYSSKIQTIVPALDPTTRTTRVRLASIAFDKPPSIEAFVVAEIETDEPEQTLIVPSASLVFYQSRQWVLKMSGVEKPVPVAVEILNDSGDKSSIRPLHGYALVPGDKIMTKGAVLMFKQLRSEGI